MPPDFKKLGRIFQRSRRNLNNIPADFKNYWQKLLNIGRNL